MKLSTLLLGSLLLLGAPALSAESFPGTKPIRFETTSAAGGMTDVVPRVLSNYLSASLGVPVLVENRPGAGGNIAAAIVARAKPDGHMLFVTGTNQAVNPTLLPQVRSGKLKALAVLSPRRSSLAPEIPTAAEAGLPELKIDGRLCILATGGTPAPVIARLDDEIAKVLQLPEIRDTFAKQDIETFHMGPTQRGEFLRAESNRFASLLEHSRLRRPSP